MKPQPQTIFGKEFGRAENYRIPSIIKTNKGTLIASADERFSLAEITPTV